MNKVDKNFGEVILKRASEITPKPIEWLWNGWLAKGKLHIFAGVGGTGKTTNALGLAAIITRGGIFPDGQKSPIGSVLMWSGEDNPDDTLIPRLIAVNADLKKIHFISDIRLDDDIRAFDPAVDMPNLIMAAKKIDDLSLLIIDPIVNAVAGDSHKNGEVRRALQPVVDFASSLNCAVLGITHFSKGGNGKDPLERVTGSLAFGALARIVLATAKINDGDLIKHIICRVKSNIGKDSGGFEYQIIQKDLPNGITASYASWGDFIDGSARELLTEPDNRFDGAENKSALDDAKQFLIELLSDGEKAGKEAENEAKEAGISVATLRRARGALKVKTSKSKLDQRWYWSLPPNMLKPTHHEKHERLEQLEHLDNVARF